MAVLPSIEVEIKLAGYEARRLTLAPEDVIIVRATEQISTDQAARLRDMAELVFPGHRVLVTAGDVVIDVVSPEEAPA